MKTEMELLFLSGIITLVVGAPQFDFNNQQPMPYNFAYGVNGGDGDQKEHKESHSPSGVTEGEYHWLQPNGLFSVTRYSADDVSGYRATVTEEPGEDIFNYYTNSLMPGASSLGSFTSLSNQPQLNDFQRVTNTQRFQPQLNDFQRVTNTQRFQPQLNDFQRVTNIQRFQPKLNDFHRVTNTQSFQDQRLTNSQNQASNFGQNSQSNSPFFQDFNRGQNFQGQSFSSRPAFQNQGNRGQTFQSQSFVSSPNLGSTGNIIDGGIIDGGIIDGGIIDGGKIQGSANSLDSGFNQFDTNTFVRGSSGTSTSLFGSSGNIFGASGNNFGSGAKIFGASGNNFGSGANISGASGNNFGSGAKIFGASGSNFGSGANIFGASGNTFGSRQDNRGVAVILASTNNPFRG